MKMDVSKFKKVSSDDKKTVLKHPRGHQIVIDHRAVSPGMRKQLHGLPAAEFADGGEVSDDRSASAKKLGIKDEDLKNIDQYDIPDAQRSPASADGESHPILGMLPNFMFEGGQNPYSDSAPPAAQAAVPAPAPQQQVGPAPASIAPGGLQQATAPQDIMGIGMDQYQQNMMHGIGEQKAGISQEAAAQAQLGQQQMAAEQEQQKFMQQANQEYQKHFQDLTNEYKNVQHDYEQQHINPNHYLENMSAGKKVATAIGLILGGMGGGLTGQGNPAERFLQEQIQRDVEGQKANLGKTENLLSMNLRQFGNLHDATQMTMAMQNGIYSSKLRQAAAQAMDPQAKARALQAAGQLDLQAAPILQSIAQRKAMTGMINSAGENPASKIRALSMFGIIPKGEDEKVYKELGEAQSMYKARDNVMSAMNQVAKLNTMGNRLQNPIQAGSQIDAIWDPMVAALSKESAGRFTEQDAGYLNALKPKLSDSDKTVQLKIQRANALISQKMHFPLLEAYGINPGAGARYNDQGASKIQLGRPVR